MKRSCTMLCLWFGLMAAASAAVNVIVSGGVLRDATGATLAPGSLVAVVASTQDNVFGVPTPSTTLQVGATFGGDDVVLAVFPVGPNTAVAGGFVGVVSFDYAAMGISNLGAGDQLKLYWFPASSLNGTQILSNATYGTYRTTGLLSRSNTTWTAPNDTSGATFELNFLTQAAGGDVDNSAAISGLTVAGSNDVTVAATSALAAEPSTAGLFTFTRTGGTTNALTVNFSVAGTATSGSDYTSLGTSVTFAAGSSTVTRSVSVIDDALIEGAETVVLTLGNGAGYTVGNPAAATVTIQDDDSAATVAVAATDPVAGETGTGQGTGTFTFTRSGGTAAALTVTFSVTGTATSGIDYATLGTTVNFATGSPTATKSVAVTDDALVEGDETVVVTLAAGSGYTVGQPASATVTIQDDDGPAATTSYVTGTTLGAVRNDYSGWVGMQILVGSNPLTVFQLGRMMAPDNTGTHTVKLVRASDGSDVAGTAVTIAMNGGTAGQFRYGTLVAPVTLTQGTTYWLVSQEIAGGDTWHTYLTQLKTTGVASDNAVVWGTGPGDWNSYPFVNQSFVPVDFKYAIAPATGTPFVATTTLSKVRNDYSGWVGMQIAVGSTPLTVVELGRMMAPGNTGTHTVKLVRASDGLDVAGGAVAIAMSGGVPGQFRYGALSTPVTLTAGATYWLVSGETAGGDTWHDVTPITSTGLASDNAVVWGTGPGDWTAYPLTNQSFVPVDFKYTTAPVAGTAFVSGVTLGGVRNDYGGWVGMQIVVGANPLTISQLGRMMAPGNTGTHTVKLVRASNGLDVAGGAVAVAMNGGTPGQFRYGILTTPVTLAAGTTYWLVSGERAGADTWHDYLTHVTTTGVATDSAVVWGTGPGDWTAFPLTNQSFVPVDFKY